MKLAITECCAATRRVLIAYTHVELRDFIFAGNLGSPMVVRSCVDGGTFTDRIARTVSPGARVPPAAAVSPSRLVPSHVRRISCSITNDFLTLDGDEFHGKRLHFSASANTPQITGLIGAGRHASELSPPVTHANPFSTLREPFFKSLHLGILSSVTKAMDIITVERFSRVSLAMK